VARQWRATRVRRALRLASEHLLAEVLRAAAAAGLPRASLGVDAKNPTGAVGVYERAGFAVEHSFLAYRRPIEPTA